MKFGLCLDVQTAYENQQAAIFRAGFHKHSVLSFFHGRRIISADMHLLTFILAD